MFTQAREKILFVLKRPLLTKAAIMDFLRNGYFIVVLTLSLYYMQIFKCLGVQIQPYKAGARFFR